MAKIILEPIGSGLDTASPEFCANLASMLELEKILLNRREKIKEGWGELYQARVKAKLKMTAHARIEALADSLDDILPLNTLVNFGRFFGEGENKKEAPNAGVITALVKIKNRWVIVIANDNTVASGSWWPKTPEKIIRAQEIALKTKIPVVYLVDCSGLFLPEQGATFPGKTGAGHIFKMNSLLSDQGVPQIAGVCGDCIAGGGYMPIISDKVYMTEQAYMVIAGAALIRGAKSQNLSSHDIGGPHVHVHISNCADIRVKDDAALIKKIQEEIASLPSSAVNYYRGEVSASNPRFNTEEILGILPASLKQVYDVRQVLARLIDDSLFFEFEPEFGQEIICGIARVSGLWLGFIANTQELFKHPIRPHEMRAGGILYCEGVKKMSRFCRVLNDDGIPMVWLQDVAGFDVGSEAEKQGLLSYGSSLIYANSTHQTPMMTVLLRKASGAGYYAMAGMPYDPVLQISTTISRLAVMEGQTLAVGAFHTKLDDNFQIATTDPVERQAIEEGMSLVRDRIESDMDPYKAAAQMDCDELVCVSELRKYLSCFAEITYQAVGYRRIKNPRIWSLHDHIRENFQQVIKPDNLDKNQKKALENKPEPAGLLSITAPMDGMFYLRSSPSEPPFVNVGQVIKPGQTLGLIEVMKCFYPMQYTGSKSATIVSVLLENATPITCGTQIFSVSLV